MPRKLIRQFIPHPQQFVTRPGLRWLEPFVKDSNLFHLNRQSVSLAFAVGVFCAFLPLPGQMAIAACLSLLVRCNLPIAVLLIWISNPLTIAPMFYLTYSLGRWLLGSPPMVFEFHLSWEWFRAQGSHLIAPLVLGSLICGIFFATVSYFAMFGVWRWKVVSDWELRIKLRRDKKNREDTTRNEESRQA